MKGGDGCCEHRANHVVVKRSLRSLVPHFVIAIIVSIVVLILGDAFPTTAGSIEFTLFGETFSVTLPLFLLICLVLIARPCFLLFNERYEIGCHHLRAVSGRMSLKREEVEIPFEDILGVRTIQSIVDRILGTGTVVAWTSLTERPDVKMIGLASPRRFAKLISERVDQALIRRKARV